MDNMIFLAVDPGVNGAWVSMDSDGAILSRMITPRDENGEVDVDKQVDWMFEATSGHEVDKVYLIVEDVHPLPGVGAASTGKFMENKGQIEGIFYCAKAFIMANVEIVKIAPQTWQKRVWDMADKTYKASRTDTKATSLKAALRLWPDYDFRGTPKSKKAHDGLVDAMLIAEAVRRKVLGIEDVKNRAFKNN